jgi:hypothetical protein
VSGDQRELLASLASGVGSRPGSERAADARPKAAPPHYQGGQIAKEGFLSGLGCFDVGDRGLHWIQGTTAAAKRSEVVSVLTRFLGVEAEDRKGGQMMYDRRLVWRTDAGDVFLFYDSDDYQRARSNHNERDCVMVPGSVCERMTLGMQGRFLCALWYCLFVATRIDAKWRDDRERVRPAEVYERGVNGGQMRGYQAARLDRPTVGKGSAVKVDGEAVTFGRKGKQGGGRQLVVYDKALESKGEQVGIDWEARWFKKRAARLVVRMAMDVSVWGDEWSELEAAGAMGDHIGAAVAGSIQFVEVREGVRTSRLEEASWWSEIRNVLSRVVFRYCPPRKTSVERKAGWIEKAVAASLAVVRRAFGESEFWEWLQAQIDTAEGMLGSHAETLVEAYQGRFGRPPDVGRRGFVEMQEAPF